MAYFSPASRIPYLAGRPRFGSRRISSQRKRLRQLVGGTYGRIVMLERRPLVEPKSADAALVGWSDASVFKDSSLFGGRAEIVYGKSGLGLVGLGPVGLGLVPRLVEPSPPSIVSSPGPEQGEEDVAASIASVSDCNA